MQQPGQQQMQPQGPSKFEMLSRVGNAAAQASKLGLSLGNNLMKNEAFNQLVSRNMGASNAKLLSEGFNVADSTINTPPGGQPGRGPPGRGQLGRGQQGETQKVSGPLMGGGLTNFYNTLDPDINELKYTKPETLSYPVYLIESETISNITPSSQALQTSQGVISDLLEFIMKIENSIF